MTADAQPARPGRPAKSARRNALLAKVHIAAKDRALSDDAYRDVLERVTGKRSAAALGVRQLDDVLAEFRRLGFDDVRQRKAPARAKAPGGRLAASPHAGKIRALWLSAWHLGVVEDPSERALAAFAKRQTGVDMMQWLPPERAVSVIEALKAWLTREAGVDWSGYRLSHADGSWSTVEHPRRRVIEAQWQRLYALGQVRIADDGALTSYAAGIVRGGPGWALHVASAEDLDHVIRTLGEWIRRVQER